MTLTTFALLLMAQQPVTALLTRALAAEEEQDRLRADYAFAELQENWGEDKSATPRTSRYENLFVEGRLYRKLVEVRGRPLSEQQRKQVEEALRRTAKERRAERRAGGKFFPGSRSMRLGQLKDLTGLLRMHLKGESTVRGLPVILLEGTPIPEPGNADAGTKELLCYSQRFWIHATEHVVVQREVTVVRKGVDLLPGTVLTSEYERPAAGMPWLEVRRTVDFSTKVYGMATARGRQAHTYTNFRKFDVESTITFEEK